MSDAHHDHGHADHGPHGHHHHRLVSRGSEGARLKLVLIITSLFMIAEVVGGLLSGSLALLADSGHMFTDVAALALSLFAMRMAQRPPNTKRTFGYVRLEILAALVNGATLLLIAGVIVLEAWQRLRDPVAIDGTIMLGVATLGLGVNIIGASLLHSHAHDNLNVRGAYLHVLGDLLGSVGAMAAGVIVLTTGWTPADAIISAMIALLILFSAWKLVREATHVLLESVPAHIDMDRMLDALSNIDGLDEVHDVHVWTLTSGFVAISAHGVIDDPTDHGRVLNEVQELVASHGIDHVTFQIEMRRLYQIPTVEGAR
jgi:cobalt-zinc-cadmium efflux system protein